MELSLDHQCSNWIWRFSVQFEECSSSSSLARGLTSLTFHSLCFWPQLAGRQRSPVGPKQPHVTVTDLTSHHLATKKKPPPKASFLFHSPRFLLLPFLLPFCHCEWLWLWCRVVWGRQKGSGGRSWRCDLDNKFLLHAIW